MPTNTANKTAAVAYFNRFDLELPADCVRDCSHSGACDQDVAHWSPQITRPAEITPDALRAELKEYGAWDETELADDEANWARLVWIAAGNIREENAQQEAAQ